MYPQVKTLGKKSAKSEEQEPDENSGDDMSEEPINELSQPEFSMDLFEQPRLRLNEFIERLGGLASQPVNLDKYRSELPAKKAQLIYNTASILTIVDSMIKKYRRRLIQSSCNQKTQEKLVQVRSHRHVLDTGEVWCSYGTSSQLICKKTLKQTEDDWQYIASLIPGKQRYACLFKWLNLKMHSKAVREPWGQAETEMLLKMVVQRKQKKLDKEKCHWSVISHRLYLQCGTPRIFRTAKQCRERWGCTNPDVKKDLWSKREDIELLKGYLEMGKKWAVISRQLVARTENAVKNRFELLEKKIANRAKKEQQPSNRNFIARYIQELEVEEYLNGPTQTKVEDALQETCQLGLEPTIPEPPLESKSKQLLRKSLEDNPHMKEQSLAPSLPQPANPASRELTFEELKKIRFCRMTKEMLFEKSKKMLVPAVMQQQKLILKPAGTIPLRPPDWIRNIPPAAQLPTQPSNH